MFRGLCRRISQSCGRSELNWTPWLETANELHRPSDHRLSAKLVPTLADRGCHVVIVTDPYSRILAFLDRSRYFFFQVAPQLYSWGWMSSVPDPLFLKKSVSAANRTQISGSIAWNSDHYTTEAVLVEDLLRELLMCTVNSIQWALVCPHNL
jgi:hypothetical protein